ncbi:carbon storage regulator CsrA [Paenibacillus senegalensis]|uniref:carbon storage regulator CsrA n=1 Tax=Paenibacillus senegalensis TaxID=1465766 RepID=UPI000289F0DF|nr:carbon storage regulator CsrA [Paenibacillus senegalensis]
MLVLTRKPGEAIMIGDDIELVVIAAEGDQIKLGIRAPKQIDIYRKEIYQMIQESNQEAAQIPMDMNEIKKMIEIKGIT